MKSRPTVELVILLLTATVCAFLLLAGAGLTILAVTQSDPASVAARAPLEQALDATVTTIVGALLGLIAGRKTTTGGEPS